MYVILKIENEELERKIRKKFRKEKRGSLITRFIGKGKIVVCDQVNPQSFLVNEKIEKVIAINPREDQLLDLKFLQEERFPWVKIEVMVIE